jgi:hypothetical protein
MNRRIGLALVLFCVVALPMRADFASVARAIDAQRGVKRIWIPFLGLARFAVRVIQPEGVHDFQLVTFTGAENVDPHDLHAIMRTKAGEGFTPLVQVWSRRSNEWSFIYARPRPRSDRIELMILAHDDEDTVLVRVDVNAEIIAREIKDKPRHVSHVALR